MFERAMAYRNGDTYVCSTCCESLCADAGQYPLRRFSSVGFGVKLFFGLLFGTSVVYQDSVGTKLMALVIGGALLAWAIVPVLSWRSKRDALVARVLSNREAKQNATKICKNCGGISHGSVCEYCGAPL